jgi:hypothetical protein
MKLNLFGTRPCADRRSQIELNRRRLSLLFTPLLRYAHANSLSIFRTNVTFGPFLLRFSSIHFPNDTKAGQFGQLQNLSHPSLVMRDVRYFFDHVTFAKLTTWNERLPRIISY